MRRLFHSFIVLLIFSAPLSADTHIRKIAELMHMREFVELMRTEGIQYGQEIENQMFPETGGEDWLAALDAIYDIETMENILLGGLERTLKDDGVPGAVAFFASDLGQRSIKLELETRATFLDREAEEAANDEAARLQSEGSDRVTLIERFSAANNLVENNVVGAMNGNVAFMTALAEAGQGPFADDPSAILNQVWGQEAEIREDTEVWVISYFNHAYAPLSDAEIEELISFSETMDGQTLNNALFRVFEELFGLLSYQLGQAAAEFMASERL